MLPLLVLAVSLGITAILYAGAANNEATKRTANVARLAETLRSDLINRLQAFTDMLPGLRALCLQQGMPDDRQFESYLEDISLQRRFPGLALTSIAQYVRLQNLAAFERSVAEDRSKHPEGHPGFQVRPPGNREEYMVLRHIFPSSKNPVGYDIYNPGDSYHPAAEAAVLADRAIATPPILLARDIGKQLSPELTSVVIRLPVYVKGSAPLTEAQRKQSIWGLVSVAIRSLDLVRSVLPPELANHAHIRIVDLDAERDGGNALIFDSSWLGPQSATFNAGNVSPLLINIGMRQWAITVRDQTPAAASWTRPIPLLVLASGLIISLLFAAFTHNLIRANKKADKRVVDATRELLKNQRDLEEAQRITRVGFFELNLETMRYTASAVVYEILGLDPAIGERTIAQYQAFIHPDDLERVSRNRQIAIEGGQPFYIDYRIVRTDGEIRHLDGRGFATCDEHGKPLRLSGAVQDVTERKRAELALADANRALQMLTRCHDELIRAENEGNLLASICRVVVDIGGYRLAWVGYAQQDANKTIAPQAHAGFENGYLSEIRLSWSDAEQGPASQSIRTGLPAIVPDFNNNPRKGLWVAAANARKLPGVICLPLSDKSHTFGMLALYPPEIHELPASELQLLQELADNLAFGIMALRTREALRDREERFKNVARATNDAVWDYNLVTGIVWRNEGWARMCGFEPDEIKFNLEMWSERVHPDDRKEALRSLDEAIEGRAEIWTREYRLLRKDGTITYVSDRAYISRDPLGNATRLVGGMTDFTERVENENRIREQAALLDRASDAIFVCDLDHVIRFWNKGAERLYGWTPAEAIGQSARKLKNRDASRFEAGIKELLAHGEWVGEMAEVRKDGTSLLVEARWTLVRDENGNPSSVLAIHTDITDRRQTEALRAAKDAAELASQAKSEFLARMSHELRTPLNSILGFAQLLQYAPAVQAEDETQKKLGHILQSGKHLVAMIDDILDLSRIEAGGLSLSPEDVDVARLVSECVGLIAPQAARAEISISLHVQADSCWIRADRTRLRQIVLNILSNAIKYNRRGGNVEVTLAAGHGDHVSITVRDTGVGLNPAQLAALFQPFNRLGAETSGIEGTGIGLVIVKQLLNVMNGTIDVVSEPCAGSTFSLSFPRIKPGIEAPLAVMNPPRQPAASLSTTGFTVLYVEDNPTNVLLVQEALKLAPGIHLEIAVDGNAGLAAAQALKPDLILLDINLPGMDGFTVFNHLRADPELAAIPCIALSANAMSAEIKRARDAGFTNYLTKPLDVETLLSTIHELQRVKSRH